MPSGIRLNKQDIINAFENEGYILLTNDFSKAKDKILVKCKSGHINYKTYDNLKRHPNCPYCIGNKKFSYQYVYEYFKLQDCLLLSTEYINSRTPLKYLCSCGNESYMTFDNFKNKDERCRECGYIKTAKSKVIPYSTVKSRIEQDDNKLLTLEKDYIGVNNDIIVECKCGNKFVTTFTRYKLRVYQTCIECANRFAQKKCVKAKMKSKKYYCLII